MAQAPIPVRTISRRNLDKGDVESIYAALVQVIGGTYFINGVSTGPSGGTLDWRSFSRYAAIGNSQKSSPNAVGVFQFRSLDGFTPINGVLTYYLAIPNGFPQPLTAIGATASFAWAGAVSVTVTIAYVRNGTTTTIATQTQATYTQDAVFMNSTGLSVPLLPGDVLKLTVTSTAAPAAGQKGTSWVGLWYKTPHMR